MPLRTTPTPPPCTATAAQNPPRIPASGDPHKLIWKLWHHPVGPADGEQEVGGGEGGTVLGWPGGVHPRKRGQTRRAAVCCKLASACLAHDPLPNTLHSTQVLLGTRVLEYELITSAALEPAAGANGMLPWRAVAEALQSGGLRLAENVRNGGVGGLVGWGWAAWAANGACSRCRCEYTAHTRTEPTAGAPGAGR